MICMNGTRLSTQVRIVMALFSMLSPCFARGDGGIVRLHESQGAFSVTVFVAARGGLADVSVLVQWRQSRAVVLDADVSLAFTPPEGVRISQWDPLCGLSSGTATFQLLDKWPRPVSVRATPEQASNKLLYAAIAELNTTGNWRLHVSVSRGADSAGFDCLLPVTMTSDKLTRLWPYLAFPPLAITAFALNQRLRKHELEKRP